MLASAFEGETKGPSRSRDRWGHDSTYTSHVPRRPMDVSGITHINILDYILLQRHTFRFGVFLAFFESGPVELDGCMKPWEAHRQRCV